jgi:ATP-binding cassette subfamily B protein
LLTSHVTKATLGVVYIDHLITSSCCLIVLSVSGLALSPLLALALGGFILILAIPLGPMKRRTRDAAEKHSAADRDFAVSMAEIVEQSRETDLFDVTEPLIDHYQQLDHEVAVSNRLIHFMSFALPAAYVAVGIIGFAGALALVELFAPSNLTAIGAMVMLLLRSIAYGQISQNSLQGLGEVGPYIVQMEKHRAEYIGRRRKFGSTPLSEVKWLELKSVSYSYGDDHPALNELDLRIDQGEKIGVAGPSGSGKSTLAQILLRLRVPSSGSYEINGIDASSYDREAWARRVAMVPQDPVFLDGTAADNIRFFRSWITDEDIRAAARAAHIEDELLAMPQGYDTRLTGLSVGLSGGQQQRLTIARALAGRPALLVLDEPTSALDSRSERLFRESIDELPGDTTVVVVAHRASTLHICDRILVLEGGSITGFDRPGALQRQWAFLGS